jgi:hypothetical protein
VNLVVRLFLLLASMLTVRSQRPPAAAWYRADDTHARTDAASPVQTDGGLLTGDEAWPVQDEPPQPPRPPQAPLPPQPPRPQPVVGTAPYPVIPGREVPARRRRRIPARVKWLAAAVVAGLIFRKAVAALVLMGLSGALHLVGVDVHLPHVRLAWPWQTISAGTTTNTDIGPWVLQKIEGISKPALGRENFTFFFTHKVSKNIGPWPCWYASTFYAVGYASATVDLNPGPSWWTPSSGHYQLQVLSRPQDGKPGHVAVTMVLPGPQLPQSVHDVTIDNIPSKPVSSQHSWTYPGFGCGVLLRPQFAQSVLYAQAQQIAYYKATHVAQVTRPLVASAETEATQTIQDNFVQPTVNAFGYTLDRFSLRWASSP